MKSEANIIVTRHDVGMGRTVNSYSFHGDPFDKIYVTSDFFNDEFDINEFPESFRIGPYHLRKAGEERVERMDCPYMLDGALWRTERVIEAFDRLRRIFTGRLIMTLHIWNLASVPPYAVPSWSHVGKSRVRATE